MSSPAAITVEPAALYFPAPHTRQIENVLALTNHGTEVYAVRLKTNQPRSYYVDPVRFLLNPGQTRDIAVTMLQSVGETVVFQVEARPLPPGQITNLAEAWPSLSEKSGVIIPIAVDRAPEAIPDNARIRQVEGVSLRHGSSSALLDPSPSAEGVTNATVAQLRQEQARAQTEAKALEDRRVNAKAAMAELEAEDAALESTREALLSEERVASGGASVNLSIVVFGMLLSYLAGMVLSRGVPSTSIDLETLTAAAKMTAARSGGGVDLAKPAVDPRSAQGSAPSTKSKPVEPKPVEPTPDFSKKGSAKPQPDAGAGRTTAEGKQPKAGKPDAAPEAQSKRGKTAKKGSPTTAQKSSANQQQSRKT